MPFEAEQHAVPSGRLCCFSGISNGGDPDGKISLLLDYCGRNGQEVADPWYTDNFDETWDDVLQGCTALLAHIRKNWRADR